ncbi:MAG: T9SS type A sorting domain-containing protein [Saprospiraceae bacterium]
MKNILIALVILIGIDQASAQVYIYQIVDKSNDLTTGKIILKDHPYGCPPYTIQVKGRTSGYDVTRPNQNPGQNGSVMFISLEADKYDIQVSNSNGCTIMLFAEVKNCAGFDISMDIPLTCNSNHALVHANIDVSLRTPPIKYEWINKKTGLSVYYWNNDGENLYPGNYIVKITDDGGNGCMTMKEFTVDNFSFNISHTETKLCKTKDDCLIKLTDAKGMTFPGRSFNYLWSDGLNNNGNSVHNRELNVATSYTLTVTDQLTQCTKSINIPKGLRASNAEFTTENCKLFSLKHYYDANDKGTASFIFNNLLVPPIKCQLYSKLTNNGTWIIGNAYNVNSTSDILKIQWMLPRYYKLCVSDSKYECEEGCVEFEIRECDGIKNQVVISVLDKVLPMDDPNFFVQVGVANSGGPCMFKYYMGSDPDNSSNYILKSGNIINYIEGLKIYRPGFKDMGIQAICPCGISKIAVNVFPCNINWKLNPIEETIVNLCYGTLPDNTVCNYNLTGSVKLVIDVTKNFNKIGAGGYLKTVKWEDNGMNAQLSQSGNIVTITRDFSMPGDYNLTFIDGLNCKYTHNIKVKQGFSYETLGACTYKTYCDETFKEPFKHATIYLTNANSCQAQISCDGSYTQTIQGRKVKGMWIGNKPNGQCEFVSYCVFDTKDEFLNTDDFVSDFKILGNLEFKGVAFDAGTNEGDCCRDKNYLTEQDILTKLLHIDHVKSSDDLGFEGDLPDQPCVAILKCDNGYYLIPGSETRQYNCKEGDECYLITDCEYENVGKIGGQYVTFSSEFASLRRLRKEQKVSFSDCTPESPECNGIFTIATDDLDTRTNVEFLKFDLIPIPFNESIDFKISLPRHEKNYSIIIHDLLGNEVFSRSYCTNNSDRLESGKILTNNWFSGIYLATLNTGSQSLVKRIIKID